MKKFLLSLGLACFSMPALAWYYNSVPGITTGLTVQDNILSVTAGTDVWLCSTRGSNRTLVFHIFGQETRDIEVKATYIGQSDSATGIPTLAQCRDATDETPSRIKVAQYRLTQSVSTPLKDGDYNVCWSGWDGYGKDARCTGGLPVTPVDDCQSELVNYRNDMGSIIVGEPVDRNFKVGDLTLRCQTAQAVTLEITQQAAAGNVLTQEIQDENGNRLEGLVVFTNGITKQLYMRSTGTPNKAQHIEDTVVVTLNYA
ncbi:hypothetical protein ABW286_14535 [Erwinia papayae]|uniref:Uncharacterized protein n=1 Tax=Erwinia papayae TaxID=206499 RepID=A0ABV3N3J2_9GAMM